MGETATSEGTIELLERSQQLSMLDEWLRGVSSSSRGRLVLVGGEAGVGKTMLLRRFCEQCGSPSVWGGCEPLFTPRPLGPLLDVAEQTGGELAEVVAGGKRPHDLVGALIRELRPRAPAVLVLEDLHWADEASLDVLALLARRVATSPLLVLASYREDELGRTHALRIVLGELPSGAPVSRLRLLPLSAAAVSTLAEGHAVDGDKLYRRTAGNPFFVSEVLAAPGADIPPTVRDAVLARMARLSPAGRDLLEAAAIVPPPVELWLLEELAGPAVDRLEECLAAGVLTVQGRDLAFRHELARIAVEDSLSPQVKVGLHAKALAALRAAPDAAGSAARLAHHADAAGAGEAVLEFAPEAAVRAAAVGAHREAAAQYARALRFAGGLSVEARAELLDARARECNSIGQLTEAIKVYGEALECHRASGDRRKEGDALRAQSFVLWAAGRRREADAAAGRAVAVLENLPPGPELAFAYCAQSNLALYIRDLEGAVTLALLALELGQRVGHPGAVAYARMNISSAAFLDDPGSGEDELAGHLEAARDAGLEELAGTAFTTLAFGGVRFRDHALARRWLEPGIQYCGEHDLDGWRPFAIALRSELELQEGRWDDAASSAAHVLAGVEPERKEGGGFGGASAVAWAVLGRVRARRGDPDHWAPLDRALALAQPTGELLRLAPTAAARAEAAWLAGRPESEAEATAAAFEVALQHKDPWAIGEIGYWLARTGVVVELPPGAAEPYVLQMAGDWSGAAERWAQLGCPYEEALALAEADEDDALRRALGRLQEMGARAAAAIVARRLRQRGATGLPRGPRPGTQANPANLTAREVEVLALVAEGLRNADIAAQLFLSERTVAHHVSAILRKLDVQSRAHASAAAVRLGIAAGREQNGP